jgi:lipid-A-disaccharide synthase
LKKILISAGEASGDFYGAKLALEILRQKKKNITIIGFGGPKMIGAGIDVKLNPVEHAAIGFWEVIKDIFTHIGLYLKAVDILKEEKPDVLIVIDSPAFHMPLIKQAKKIGVKKVIYYSTPQVWVWKPQRINELKKYTDLCVVVLPFEEKLLKDAGINARYFGHPMAPYLTPAKPSAGEKIVGIFPGSRVNEIKSFTEDILKACALVKLSLKNVKFVLFKADTIKDELISPYLEKYQGLKIKVAQGADLKMKSSLSAAIAKSGTVTLELAIMGIPMAIVYRVSGLSYLMMKNIIKLKYVGLPNILLDKPAVKEFLQHDFKPDKVGHEITAILKDKKYSAGIIRDLDKLRGRRADASKVVVNIAHEIIREASL